MSVQEPSSLLGKPRVVHVTTSHLADDVRIFDKECRSLAASGRFDVVLAAHGQVEPSSGISHVPLMPPPPSRFGRFRAGPKRGRALTQVVEADLWHFHDPELLPVALRMAKSGMRVIWDAHEDYVQQFNENGSKEWVPRPLRRVVRLGTEYLLRRVDKRVTAVVAATPAIASGYRNSRTVVVGNEARLETFQGCSPSFESRRVLFTGQPGPGHLFLEVAEAVATVEGASLAVAGRPPDVGLWQQAESMLGNRLVHLGWLSRQGVVDAINSSAIGLSTYADLPTNAENSPNKLFEFGAGGLPVVATPTASNLRRVGESKGGLVTTDFDPKSIARSIAELLDDRELWEAASDSARRWANQNGSWVASEKKLLELYAQIFGMSRVA
jgi:glycosyltransferase involved in cell wall biosynthesis